MKVMRTLSKLTNVMRLLWSLSKVARTLTKAPRLEAAQETLNGSGTAGKVVVGDKAATRTRDRLGFRAVSTADLTSEALFWNVVEGEL